MGAMATNTPGMPVRVRADDGWLVVEKRRMLGGRKSPFALRVPLAALIAAEAGKPRIGLVGSSIALGLATGDELVLDVMAGKEPAAVLARRFREAGASAQEQPPPWALTLELLAVPPPPRTSPPRAAVMMMACGLPFIIAMMGSVDGPFAAVASTLLFLAGLGLMLGRPVWMGRILARGAWATAGAFAIDTISTGQILRVAGVVCCVALAIWMGSLPTEKPDRCS
jgi:hypothetical protein